MAKIVRITTASSQGPRHVAKIHHNFHCQSRYIIDAIKRVRSASPLNKAKASSILTIVNSIYALGTVSNLLNIIVDLFPANKIANEESNSDSNASGFQRMFRNFI